MPRRSTRDILAALRSVQVDASGKGATVSDEIQLTYLLDDLRDSFWVTAGAGTNIPNGIGDTHTSLQIECRNKRGLEIDSMGVVFAVGNNNTLFAVKVQTGVFTMTNEVIIPAIISGLQPPLAIIRTGEVPHATFTGARVTMGSNGDITTPTVPGWGKGIRLDAGQSLLMAQDSELKRFLCSILWHEFDRELAS